MATANTRQGINELRDEAFRLVNALSCDAALAAAPAAAIEAATQMQSVAYLLGQIEGCLPEPGLTPSSPEVPTQGVG